MILRRKPDEDGMVDGWLEALGRAYGHVPLSLYDEDQKPAERAVGEMLTKLKERHYALQLLVYYLDLPGGFHRSGGGEALADAYRLAAEEIE